MSYTVRRFHDISCGHRVFGHESKCAHLHGHNYRIHFVCEPLDTLDKVGRVIDFSDIKTLLCEWLETNWDHKFLVWTADPLCLKLIELDPDGVVGTFFNPTAENMAKYLVTVVGPSQLMQASVQLQEVTVEETPKCSATYQVPKVRHYEP